MLPFDFFCGDNTNNVTKISPSLCRCVTSQSSGVLLPTSLHTQLSSLEILQLKGEQKERRGEEDERIREKEEEKKRNRLLWLAVLFDVSFYSLYLVVYFSF